MQSFDYWQLIYKFRNAIIVLILGLIFSTLGLIIFKSSFGNNQSGIEVLSESTVSGLLKTLTVEISGEVLNPGVYKLTEGSRVDDLLTLANGFTKDADSNWIEKYLNRAGKITDGQKIYIPGIDEQSAIVSANKTGGDQNISSLKLTDSNSIININTASLDELDRLPGIGPVYGQSIIEHRPYSTVEELLSKGALKESLYEKIKSFVSVY